MKELNELKGTYTPEQALVLYKDNSNSYSNKYLEVVDIKNGVMCNPTPASLELVGKMIANVQYESQTKTIYWKGRIPKDLLKLHCNPDYIDIVLVQEACKQQMHFRNEMYPSGVYNVPKLCFHIRNSNVNVYAVGNKCKAGTTLYRAPFLNVGNSGSTCMGSATPDDWKKFDSVNSYVSHVLGMFWNSEFSEIHGTPVEGSMSAYMMSCVDAPPKLKQLTKIDKILEDIL